MPANEPNRPLWKAGCIDLEYDLDPTARADPITSWTQTLTDRPDPTKHVVARLFYPANPIGKTKARQSSMQNFQYARGLAKFATVAAHKKWWQGLLTSTLATITYFVFKTQKYPAEPGRDLAADIAKLPVIVFSHGISGTRSLYSTLCAYLAAHGFVVMAVEHTDGLSSAAKPAGKRKWLYYSAWGNREYLEACSRHREQEVATCMRVLTAIDMRGATAEHVTVSCKLGRSAATGVVEGLKGRLDLQNITLVGHSYGSGTVAGVSSAATTEESPCKIVCLVMYDPYYPAIPDDSPARKKWLSGCPTLVIGSSSFNTPAGNGTIRAEGSEVGLQEQVLHACARGVVSTKGGEFQGATLIVPNESPHIMVDDVGAVLMDKYSWMIKLMGSLAPVKVGSNGAKRQPSEGKDLAYRCYDAALAFLLQTLTLNPTVYACVSQQLSSRWTMPPPFPLSISSNATEAHVSFSDAKKEEGLMSRALGVFFEGLRSNPEDDGLAGTGNGWMIAQDFLGDEAM